MNLYYKLNMEKMPENCKECKVQFCSLPLKKNKYEPEIKKEYMTKRHKQCPLIAINEKESENIEISKMDEKKIGRLYKLLEMTEKEHNEEMTAALRWAIFKLEN